MEFLILCVSLWKSFSHWKRIVRTVNLAFRKLIVFNYVSWVYLIWPSLDGRISSLSILWRFHRIMPWLAHQYLQICLKICHIIIKVSTWLYCQGLRELSKSEIFSFNDFRVTYGTWTLQATSDLPRLNTCTERLSPDSSFYFLAEREKNKLTVTFLQGAVNV